MKYPLLLPGDCVAALDALPAGLADAVITDPPYGVDFKSNMGKYNRLKLGGIRNDDRPFVEFLPGAARVLKNAGCLICFCRWDVQEAFRVAIEGAGLEVRAQLVWHKQGGGMGDLEGAPAPDHEVAWFAAKGPFKFHGRRPMTVLSVPRVPPSEMIHPNQKPVGLLKKLVTDYCPPGGVVVDTFMGSGVTGVACLAKGRRFVGMELDPKYYQAAGRRIRDPRNAVEADFGLV